MSNLTPWTKRLIIIGVVAIAIAAMFTDNFSILIKAIFG